MLPIISSTEEGEQAINLTYADEKVQRLDDLFRYVLNPLEKKFGAYYISSLHRNGKTQHSGFTAVDLDFDLVPGVTNSDAYNYIRDTLNYDQLIIYHRGKHMSHIHISFVKENNRKEVLRCYRWKGRTWYKHLKKVG